MENVEQVVRMGLCNGCGVCALMCPSKAIKIVKDNVKGVYLPIIAEERCENCGLCLEACFGTKPYESSSIRDNWEDFVIGKFLNFYVGHACDRDIRYNSSSGGIITALSLHILDEGIVDGILVTRMSEQNPLEPELFIATSKSEVLSASRSKYCPVPLGVKFESILKKKGRCAIVGLPCHIYGARKAEALYPNLAAKIPLHLGIFCSGTPNFLATEYLLRRLRIKKEQIVRIEYRGEGWPGNMTIEFQHPDVPGKRNLQIPYPKYWEGLDFLFHPHRCTLCDDRFNRLADLSCGDAWLPEYQNDTLGTSLIITRNEVGERLLTAACEKGYIQVKSVHSVLRLGQAQKLIRTLQMRIRIQEALGKPLPPRYSAYMSANRELNSPTLGEYTYSIFFNLMRIAASKRYLWNLLDLYLTGKRFAKRLKIASRGG